MESQTNDKKSDIHSRAHIARLVETFYGKVNVDPMLAPVFSHVNWPEHLPVMVNFWASMMLGDSSYQGNPFQKHIPLAIGREHFSRWLQLFTETVDEGFAGPQAEEIKARAISIAALFQHRLNLG